MRWATREGPRGAETNGTRATWATDEELSPHQTHGPACYLNPHMQGRERTESITMWLQLKAGPREPAALGLSSQTACSGTSTPNGGSGSKAQPAHMGGTPDGSIPQPGPGDPQGSVWKVQSRWDLMWASKCPQSWPRRRTRKGREQAWKAGGYSMTWAPFPRGRATPKEGGGVRRGALLTSRLVPGPLTGNPRELSSSMAPKIYEEKQTCRMSVSRGPDRWPTVTGRQAPSARRCAERAAPHAPGSAYGRSFCFSAAGRRERPQQGQPARVHTNATECSGS